jgi:hypothetical protein
MAVGRHSSRYLRVHAGSLGEHVRKRQIISSGGRIKDIQLINLQTGDVAYRVSPPGLRGLWSSAFSVDAADVAEHSFEGIILGAEPSASSVAA